MRLNQLLAGLMGVAGACVVGVPAKASQLQSWQFDASQNRLTFITGSSVQPRARLLSNPHRLVVELPGIGSDEVPTSQQVGGAVQAVRLEQAEDQATRMVLELNPDYEITPQQIQVWGITSQQWIVQLPHGAEPATLAPNPLPPEIRPYSPLRPPGVPAVPTQGTAVALPSFVSEKGEMLRGAGPKAPNPEASNPDGKQVETAYASPTTTQLQGVLTTPNGFFIQTGGSAPQVQVYRVRDRNQSRQLVLDVLNAQLGSHLGTQPLPNAQYGVSTWSLTQFGTSPPAVRIILTLDASAPEWQVTPIRQGGIVLLPMGAVPASTIAPAVAQPAPAARPVTLPPIGAPLPATQTASRAFPQNPQPLTLPPINSPPTQALPTQGQPMPNRVLPYNAATVVLDPGHGGADPGAVGINGLQEKQVVWAITQQVAAALTAQGIHVVLTRQGDQEVDLQPRVDIAEQTHATLFVSIHANAISLDRPEVNGVETYYYSDMGARFAQVLHNRVLSLIPMGDRGTRQARFYVLRRTSMPAVLIEAGFVTGSVDAPQLANPAWRTQMGNAIATGILDYLRQGF